MALGTIPPFLNQINLDYGTDLKMTCDACPVQIEGQVGAYRLYFRARWEEWAVAIADSDKAAVQAVMGWDVPHLLRMEGECEGDFTASWMDNDEVDYHLRAFLDEWNKNVSDNLRTSFREALTGQTHPLSELWDGIDPE